MGDGTKENPFTREDVLNLIEENGGKAEGLDLSGKVFKDSINLRQLNLERIILNNATLNGAHFESSILHSAMLKHSKLNDANFNNAGLNDTKLISADLFSADFTGAHCEACNFYGANLINAKFLKTELRKACFDKANLMSAKLESAKLIDVTLYGTNLAYAQFSGNYLFDMKISNDTKLEDLVWKSYVIAEEMEQKISHKDFSLRIAESTYRKLKIWYTEHGIYDVAGKFFYREMEVKRKAQIWKKNPLLKIWYGVMRWLCGYGEKPERVVISAAVVIIGSALVYFSIGTLLPNGFLDCLYYSAVSFIAVGYGGWVKESIGWVKGLGVIETFLGFFMMSLFLVTFTRKMTR
jgi:hypothetical protein